MGQSPDLCWQVLQDEDEWWEERDEAPAGAGPVDEPRRMSRKVAQWRLLSLALAGALLLTQLFWLFAGQEASAEGSAAAAAPPRYVWESGYFVFAYGRQEQAAAAEAGRLLDGRYGLLRRSLGFAAAPAEVKIRLRVDGEGVNDADAFACVGLSGLVDETVAQALPPAGGVGSWRVTPGFVLGLRGWAQGGVCPQVLAGQGERFAQHFGGRLPLLAELRPALYDFPYRGAGAAQSEREGAAFALLFAYAQERYGSGRLPLLLEAVQQPVTWAQTIPAVYGVSAEEFEAGWREWLVREYGVAAE